VALYDYRCRNGHLTEVFHRVGDTPEVACERCGSPAVRVFSPPMIHTQYYFSPQVSGARRPRYAPPGEAEKAPGAAASRGAGDDGVGQAARRQTGTPKAPS
jgi:putative FmdB family regulatory protein